MRTVFWLALICVGLPIYSYVGYPLLLFVSAVAVQAARDAGYLLSRKERRQISARKPRVSVILAAYNEEKVIERTIKHWLALDYPPELLEIIVGSDASSDRTVEIAQQYSAQGVRVLAFPERRGKMAVISDSAACAEGEILVLSDANTIVRPDAVAKLVRHFDHASVGAVCGELHLVTPGGTPGHEGAYWRYEVTLKILESRLDSVLGANGAIYAIRRELFPKLPHNVITDDFMIPMKVRAKDFRVLYDPEAIAIEEAPTSISDEFRRRMRIGAGNWQALWHCRSLLLPWRGFVSVAYGSHKVIRWFTPFLLPVGFLASALLLSNPIGRLLFTLQACFYLAALLGWLLGRVGFRIGLLRLASYFLAINAALGLGMVRGVFGLQRAAWRRTAREAVAPARATE